MMNDIRAARLAHLKNVWLLKFGSPTIYTSHTKEDAWGDGTNLSLPAPIYGEQ
jgi:hypothetical protein